MTIYLGLDIGTTSLSAVGVHAQSGEVLSQVTLPNDAAISCTSVSGLLYAELDLNRLRDLLKSLLGQVTDHLPDASRVRAIGVTGQQHGMALLDSDLSPIGHAITWQDQRALETLPDSDETYMQAFIRQAGGPSAFHSTGCLPALGFMGPTLTWLSRHEMLSDQAAHACLIPDAAVAILTQALPRTDPTNAGSSGLYDLTSGDWAWETIDRLELPRGLFAPIGQAGIPHAPLVDDVARSVGLEDVPVCIAAGDNQASFVGSVREPDRSLLVNVGTGGQVSATISEFARLPTVETRAFWDERYLMVGATLYGGQAYAYLQEFFQEVGATFWGMTEKETLYERMNALAAEVPPGAEGLRCYPLFTGTRTEPGLRASFTGIGPTNLRPGHLARALLEGVAEGFYTLYQEMAPLLGERDLLIGAGNGISRNPVLAEIMARRFERNLYVSAQVEAAALGAALLAMRGMEGKRVSDVMALIGYDQVITAG